jgi:hypothetical protein
MKVMGGRNNREIAVQAELCHGHQLNVSAGFNERLKMSGNLRRGKLIEPMFIDRSVELPFLDRNVENKASDAVNQSCNAPHLGNNGRTSKGSDRRFAQNGAVFFERAVGSFGSGSQGVQLPIR